MAKNEYIPLDVTLLANPDTTPDAVTTTQYAVERLQAISGGTANPDFALTSSRNRLVENGGSISRGYIRRSSTEASDPTSDYRLYFMYNPETIQRSYVSYLDQIALDPNNALFGSNNMAAAPGLVDFTFELLFDRQIEVARDPANPGTKVDYDYFDLVVRGVVPDTASSGNAIPDNGVMMVNPHSITVVFGQDLSVQGRVTNASVNFQRFNNAMIPTRMLIRMSMKALYIGSVQTVPNYSLYSSEQTYEATIPYETTIAATSVTETVTLVSDTTPSAPGTPYPNPYIDGVTAGDNRLSFANAVLMYIAAPINRETQSALLVWMHFENNTNVVTAGNNPLNIQAGDYPHVARTGGGQYIFSTPSDGATITGRFLLENGFYTDVVAKFREGTDTRGILRAVEDSPWAEGHYSYQMSGEPIPISDDWFNTLANRSLTQEDPNNTYPA